MDSWSARKPYFGGPGTGWTRGDTLFRALVILAVFLEIIVLIEPAPVDVVIVLALGVGLFLAKLDFSAVEPVPLLGLVVFAVANLVSMYDPLDLDRAIWYVLVTLYLVGSWFFFVGLIGRYGEPLLATLVNTYCFAGLISAFLGIGGYFNLLPFQDTLLRAGRAKGLFKDCNVYGPYFVPIALYALTRLMEGRAAWREKAYSYALFLSATVAMLLCFSRACWLNFVVALVVFFVVQRLFVSSGPGAQRQLLIGAGVLIVGGLAVIALLDTEAVQQMLAMRVTSSGLQGYDRVRFETQSLALETFEKRPFGIGPGQSEVMFDYATHSMYMRILSENGVIALVGMLVFIGATAVRSLTVARRAESEWLRNLSALVFACIIGHLANSFVIDTVHWRHIWFVYALPWIPMRTREYASRLRLRYRQMARRGPLVAIPQPLGR